MQSHERKALVILSYFMFQISTGRHSSVIDSFRVILL